MRGEEQLFLALLRRAVHGDDIPTIPVDLDWGALEKIAREQSLIGLCYVQLRDLKQAGEAVPDQVLQRFHEGFFNDVYAWRLRQEAAEAVFAAFSRAGIPFVPFKGWTVQESWPACQLRSMGDIDVLIHTEDRESSDRIMQQMGYSRFVDNHAVWTYTREHMMFELHDHIFYEHLNNDVDYVGYFDRAWDYADGELDPSFHFLYVLTHLAKHTVNKGMGFRAYLDMVFLCRTQGVRLRWDWILSELEKLKLRRFAETCLAFCREWFGWEPPFSVPPLGGDFAALVTEKMFRDGTFGLENEENAGSIAAKEISHDGASYERGALRLVLRRIFPPYGDLQLIPWYSFVDGRPWLLPAAWVYRWFYVLRHKREQGAALLTEPYRIRKQVEQRQQFISDWGL